MANLITVDTYKEIAGITSTKEDTKLDILVPAISQLVKTYCGNSIIDYYTTEKTELFTIDWNTHLVQLTESPVISVSSVYVRESVTDNYSALSADDWYLETTTDSIYRIYGSGYQNFPQGAGSVKVVYNAGYSECPADLQLAVADLITYYLRDEYKTRQTLSGATRENPESSLRNGVAFPDHIKRVLDLYKNF